MSEAIAFCSFEEFLAAEQAAERSHELVGGRVYAMAGGSERHDLVAGLIYETLAATSRARRCRPFTSNRLVRTPNGNAYYPDVMVACVAAAHRLYETEPVLIVEVLSHSTADTDRREKVVAYAQAASMRRLLPEPAGGDGGTRTLTGGGLSTLPLPIGLRPPGGRHGRSRR